VALVTDDKSVGQIRGYVKCVFEEGLLKVSSSSSVSSVSDEVEIDKKGNDITIAFNCKYLLDALRSITDDKVKLSLATPLMSVLIEPVEKREEDGKEQQDEGRFLYMVCPVKMKE
jgi:DNA polymerase-3 subunit beta